MALVLEDGDFIYFDRISEGSSYDDAVYEHTASASEFYGARISWNGDGWDLRLSDGTFYVFPEAYYAKNFAQGAATEMNDSRKHRILLKRDGARNLTEVISPSGRRIFFTYDDHARITEARGDDGQVFKYVYNRSGLVDSVRDQNHELYHFVYEREKMITILDSKGEPILQNYYRNGVIVAQELPGKVIYRFSYELNSKGRATKATVKFPSGEEKVFYFNEQGIASSAKTP